MEPCDSEKRIQVSIVIPVYNGSNYLRDAIESALAQTWPFVEVIVVNDGSNDDGATDRIAQSFGNRIRYIVKSNGGVASALNAGIGAMSGEIFCWLSHDDRHLPHKIERQIAEWERRGRVDAVLISNYRLIDSAGSTITDVELNHDLISSKPQYALLRGSIHGCSVFVPKRLFEIVGLFDERLPTTQDYDLWHRMMRSGFLFHHMPEILIESRWHDEQSSKKLDHAIEATDFWTQVVSEIPVRERENLEGTNYRFLVQMAAFLNANKLSVAAERLLDEAERELSKILVSIVIPVYNRYHLLAGAMNSVGQQSHKRIEVIVVDDGSTEDPNFLNGIIRNYDRPIHLLRQENAGPAAARNAGWRVAAGKYVAFLDADDLFLPNKVETQLRFMESENSAFSHTSYFLHWSKADSLKAMHSGLGNTFPEIIGGCSIATPTVMLRTRIFDELRFPEDTRLGEDNILWIRLGASYGVNGLDHLLTIVRASEFSTAYDQSKLKQGVRNILAAVKQDTALAVHTSQIAKLESFLQAMETQQQ